MPFKKGQSGNPQGRPKGALNKATLAAQQLLDGEAQEITRKVIELAKEGNPMALRLCLERLLPRRKDRPISLELPEVKIASDVPPALQAILAAVGQGEITPSEADILADLVGATQKAITQTPPESDEGFPEEYFEDAEFRGAYLKLMVAHRKCAEKYQTSPKHTRSLERAAPQGPYCVLPGNGEPEGQEEGEKQDNSSPPRR